MRFQILGGLSVVAGERTVDLGTPKQRAVLAVLLLERDRVVSVDRLLELLWGESSDKAQSSLQVYVSRLRTALEPGRRPRDPATVLVSQSPGYRIAVARGDVDLYRFEDTVAHGLDLLRRGDHAEASATLTRVLADWSGALLPEFGDEPFVIAAAGRVEGVRLAAVEGAAEARLASGDHSGAVALLEPDVTAHPTRGGSTSCWRWRSTAAPANPTPCAWSTPAGVRWPRRPGSTRGRPCAGSRPTCSPRPPRSTGRHRGRPCRKWRWRRRSAVPCHPATPS